MPAPNLEAALLGLEDIERLRGLFDESVAERPIADDSQANAVLAEYSSLQQASDRLFDLLVTIKNTGSTVGLIRDLANHFYMAEVIDGSSRHIAEALSNLAAYIPGVAQPDGRKIEPRPLQPGEQTPQHVPAYVRSFDCQKAWKEALLIARASSLLGRFPFSNARTKAVTTAAARMKQRGYVFTIDRGAVRLPHPEIEKIVADVENSLRELGCVDALSNISRLALNTYRYAYEQILFGQGYASGLAERSPTIPIGLLFNIAVKLPLWADGVADRPAAWNNAVSLARDFVAMLDLEAYTHFAFMGTDASRLEAKLREIAHYDHCFALRQWRLSFTSEFLTTFFGVDCESGMKTRFGWNVSDVAQLARVLTGHAKREPTIVAVDVLVSAGMDRGVLRLMIPYFTHRECEANKNYRSPFDTAGADIIFRPAILFEGHQFLLLPPASLIGPAIFEATFAAVKSISRDRVISKLRGDGTERLAALVFGKCGFRPSIENAKYDLGAAGKGECDLVFEDEQNILLVECKAKSLTRGAMTGASGDALLDFAGGLFASQGQALRHERILRSRGVITFLDGRRLELRDRRITRLTVTLADHGTLQNRWMLNMVYEALLSARVSCSPNHPRKKQVDRFNENLETFKDETRLLLAAGHDRRALALNAASTSIAQLDVILEGAQSLGEVRDRLALPINFSTFNVLLEHFNIERMRSSAQPVDSPSQKVMPP
jgi:hypothetical protein